MVKRSFWIVPVMMLVMVGGCRHASVQPTPAAAVKGMPIYVLVDDGVKTDMNEDEVQQIRQLSSWMQDDLVRMFIKAGYKVKTIEKRNSFPKGAGEKYLLTVGIVRYNPGSTAARIIVGFGAGAASLDTEYKLYNNHNKLVLSDQHGVGSGRDWRYCARKLNQQTLAAVNTALN